jgi:purine-nucleoside phosphorylase
VRYLRRLGDAVGMSTVAEALAAHAAGMRVAGVSCITNLAAGLSGHKLSHAEVVETTSRVKGELCDLLEGAVPLLVE